MKNYKTPILSSIFNVFGIIVLVVAGIWVVLGIITVSESDSILAPLPTIGAALMLVLSAMIYFGISQVIDFLGRTAHSTENLCQLVKITLSKQINNIEHQLTSDTNLSARTDRGSAVAPSAEDTSDAVYYYSAKGNQEGPYTANNLSLFYKVGDITDDTLVFREGDSQWRPYSEFSKNA